MASITINSKIEDVEINYGKLTGIIIDDPMELVKAIFLKQTKRLI